jgi:hypothetical protein
MIAYTVMVGKKLVQEIGYMDSCYMNQVMTKTEIPIIQF